MFNLSTDLEYEKHDTLHNIVVLDSKLIKLEISKIRNITKNRNMPRTRFRVNPESIVDWMSRESLLEAGAKSEV